MSRLGPGMDVGAFVDGFGAALLVGAAVLVAGALVVALRAPGRIAAGRGPRCRRPPSDAAR